MYVVLALIINVNNPIIVATDFSVCWTLDVNVLCVCLLCLDYVAPMGVSMACIMWYFYDLNYGTACACLYDTSMVASMIYL
jgi:hypothetical protein